MSNRLPRALLADIAAVIGSGDHASALMMLGDESGPEASAAVSSYRAQCAAALGDFPVRDKFYLILVFVFIIPVGLSAQNAIYRELFKILTEHLWPGLL